MRPIMTGYITPNNNLQTIEMLAMIEICLILFIGGMSSHILCINFEII